MEKTHDFEIKAKSQDRASANESVRSASSADHISVQPPLFQLKAEPTSEKEESKEENASVESTYQLAAEGTAPPDDNSSDGSDDQSKPNNTGLPTQLKSGIESLSGFSLDDVKVHYNSDKPTQLKAHAYAQGTDIHVASGQERHLPHEAWHVVQQKQGRVQPTTQLKAFNVNDDAGLEKEADIMGAKAMQMKISKDSNVQKQKGSFTAKTLQGKFVNSKVGKTRTTLRTHVAGENENFNVGNSKIGISINRGTKLLVNDSGDGRRIPGDQTNERYRQAINVDIKDDNLANIPDNKTGWIKANKVNLQVNPSLDSILLKKIRHILSQVPNYSQFLNTEETARKILLGAVRYKESGNGWKNFTGKSFARALQLTEATVIPKLQAGAIFTGNMLNHWKNELGADVQVTKCTLTESDLHEHGLGVVFTKFRKTGPGVNPMWNKFAGANQDLEVVLKPEDKSLEEALIGSHAGSAANQINNLLGLDDEESLATIKMETSPNMGSMIEKVQGASMKDTAKQLAIQQGDDPNQGDISLKNYIIPIDFQIAPAFHETMTFAFIAGIGDLHWENVMYDKDAKPVMIDADNVAEHDQMEKQNFGANAQSGFSTFNNTEASQNNQAMTAMDADFDKSKLFSEMFHNPAVRNQIAGILKNALAGKSARVVPVGTGKWAGIVNDYKGKDDAARTNLINQKATENHIVNGIGPDGKVGAGLIGNCFVAAGGGNYAENVERQQLKADFDGGIIPFYNYDFDSGNVTHNGPLNIIYKGQTANEAIDNMIEKFVDAQMLDMVNNLFS